MKPETLQYTHLIGWEGLTFLTSYTSILRGIDLMLYRVDSRQSKWSSSLAHLKEGNGWERVRCWRSGESIQLTKGKTSIKLEFEPCAQFRRAFIVKCAICHITVQIDKIIEAAVAKPKRNSSSQGPALSRFLFLNRRRTGRNSSGRSRPST